MRKGNSMSAGRSSFVDRHLSSLPSSPAISVDLFFWYLRFLFVIIHLALELLDALVVLAGDKGERDNARNVHLGAEDVHVEAELDADGLDVLETLLVVGAGAADPDLDLVLVEERSDLAESADDTLESGGDLWWILLAKVQVSGSLKRENLRW